jgi:hypothetical protein
MSPESTTSSVWSVPKWSATVRAYPSSLYAPSLKPTEKVFTFELWRVMRATMVEESRPPERNAPNGTSLTIWIRTASSRRSRNSPPETGGALAGSQRLPVGAVQ